MKNQIKKVEKIIKLVKVNDVHMVIHVFTMMFK